MNNFFSELLRMPTSMAQFALEQLQSSGGMDSVQQMSNGWGGASPHPPFEFGSNDNSGNTLVEAVNAMSRNFSISTERIVEALGGRGGELPVFDQAKLGPYEEVLICYTVGTLKFIRLNENLGGRSKSNVTYGLLDMDLYDITGKLNGRYLTVWKPEKPPKGRPEGLEMFTGPWFEKDLSAMEAIPKFDFRANSVAEYSFEDKGGSIYATGPANLLIVPVGNRAKQFQISVATYITGGTGAFSGATGVNTALGSSFIPPDFPEFDFLDVPHNMPEIPGVTVSTFRLVRNEKVEVGNSLYRELPRSQGVPTTPKFGR